MPDATINRSVRWSVASHTAAQYKPSLRIVSCESPWTTYGFLDVYAEIDEKQLSTCFPCRRNEYELFSQVWARSGTKRSDPAFEKPRNRDPTIYLACIELAAQKYHCNQICLDHSWRCVIGMPSEYVLICLRGAAVRIGVQCLPFCIEFE